MPVAISIADNVSGSRGCQGSHDTVHASFPPYAGGHHAEKGGVQPAHPAPEPARVPAEEPGPCG